MSNRPAPKDADSLFDLFREFACYEIVDERHGRTSTVGMRALEYFENQQLMESIESAGTDAKKKYDTPETRERILEDMKDVTPEQIVDAIITIEKGTVAQNADLAPSDDEGEKHLSPEDRKKAEEEREKQALEKWEQERRKQLLTLGDAAARNHLVELQVRALILVARGEALAVGQLVVMVQDPFCPECLKRVKRTDGKWTCCDKWPPPNVDDPQPFFKRALSNDKDKPNYIGRLMPTTRRQLNDIRLKFLTGQTDKDTRKAAEDPAFLPSGESRNEPTESRGETTATSPSSQPASQPSTP